MSKMKKIVSLVLVAMMLVGFALPTSAVSAAEMTNVVVHKLELSDLADWPKSADADGTIEGVDGSKYNGSAIGSIEGYFGAGSKELDGVFFTYWKITEDQYKKMVAEPGKYDDVAKTQAFLGATQGTKVGPTANGQGLTVTNLEDGYYWFVEHKDSLLADGKTLAKAAAVPFGLQLPVFMADGTRFTTDEPLHVYPKNTVADKPKTDKNFTEAEIDLDNNQAEKATKDVFVGQEVPYVVRTEIPAKAAWKTAKWNDQMTEGLTFNEDSFKIGFSETAAGPYADLAPGEYTLALDGNGFKVELTETGLAKTNDKEAPVYIRLTYTATVNDKAVVDVKESNDVTFHYGNNPSHGNTPKPNKPNPEDKSITVSKSWAEGDGTAMVPPSVEATVVLKNAQTGAVVGNPIKLNAGNNWTHKFTDLDVDTEYVVEETYISGYSAEYTVEGPGVSKIKNYKDNNPEPLNPTEPKVVSGGHRFQKVDAQTQEGLAGATFVIKKDNQFLAKKEAGEKAAEQADYAAKQKAYLDLVKADNPDQVAIEAAKVARDKAYEVAQAQWKFVASKDDAATFTSGEEGFFKVTGLAYGTYTLVETVAPTGYAQRADLDFEVTANSAGEATKLEAGKANDPTQTLIDNKKITIPQTGGRGTILFTIVGIAIMGTAVVAMKRRNAR